MIDQTYLSRIGKFLDLEKIQVIQKQSVICFPKKVDEDFLTKFKQIEKEFTTPFIEIKMIEEGEIENGIIEFSTESHNNGTTG